MLELQNYSATDTEKKLQNLESSDGKTYQREIIRDSSYFSIFGAGRTLRKEEYNVEEE
jgi:hypothetical protein